MPTWSDLPAMRLGSYARIPILLDVTSVLAIFTVLLSVLRLRLPNIGDYGIVLVLVVCGVFLSILVHELGHAFVARRFGLRTEEIRIGGFYGLALLSGPPRRRIESVLILLAGPFANAVLYALLSLLLRIRALDGFLRPESATGEVDALRVTVEWLAYANLGMLIFNLLPAFPLDGGRVARLLLERVLDYRRSVQLVAGLGILIGVWCCFVMILYPVLFFVIPYLVFTNYAIFRGQIAAPEDK
jgi:Zn-dependent protease